MVDCGEIAKVRASLFQINGVKKEPLILPEPDGPVTTLTEKVYVPVKEHPDGLISDVHRISVSVNDNEHILQQKYFCKKEQFRVTFQEEPSANPFKYAYATKGSRASFIDAGTAISLLANVGKIPRHADRCRSDNNSHSSRCVDEISLKEDSLDMRNLSLHLCQSTIAKFARDAWYARQVFIVTCAHESSTGPAPTRQTTQTPPFSTNFTSESLFGWPTSQALTQSRLHEPNVHGRQRFGVGRKGFKNPQEGFQSHPTHQHLLTTLQIAKFSGGWFGDGISHLALNRSFTVGPVNCKSLQFNFVGRILGPRGMTAKQLEQETGCKIMVRGKGSMRDKKKEDQNRGKPNWEHLSDELHVLLTVEDTENRAQVKLQRAVEEVKKLLVPQADGEDELKKRQLMELAIINGTYRDSTSKAASVAAACDEEWRRLAASVETQRLLSPAIPGLATPLRNPQAPLGAPLILSPRMSVPTTAASILNGSAPPGSLLSPGDPHGLIYTPYADYTNYAALAASPLLTEYATADHSALTDVQLLSLLSSEGIWDKLGSILTKELVLSHKNP
ncbi:hypothetical protein NQ318_002721 [Aromia moschata]|uniref:K Homology domain-containing protein n=1 Tax=Aromia moschata TaxID=1265417 RepID=A0AAV8Y520_9CUCU|nr:hypothetical protein NQ318_002721 [Aromia moschata]